jgi:hypothetical protein
MDIDNLDLREDFAEAIRKSVGSCDILIAVIGRRWLDASDSDGNRRLDNPDDFVRLEISTALKRKIHVIPVLVGGAVMPRPTQLPEDLQSILRYQAIEVTHNRFAADSERIIEAINPAFEKAPEEEAEREKVRLDAERTVDEYNRPHVPTGRNLPEEWSDALRWSWHNCIETGGQQFQLPKTFRRAVTTLGLTAASWLACMAVFDVFKWVVYIFTK